MKMFKMLVALAFVLALGASAHAETSSKFPRSQGGLAHENLNFFGVRVSTRILASTDATVLVKGEGFLDAICPIGGTLGQYSMAYDTWGDPTAANMASYTYAISPQVYVRLDTGSNQGGWGAQCFAPTTPIKFVYGLYGKQSHSGHNTLYYWHCSDGENPCIP